MIKTFINAWKIADLRKKMLYTVFILFLFRLGCAIPIPFIDITQDNGLIGDSTGTFLNYLSMMTGDAFNYGRVFALGITPFFYFVLCCVLFAGLNLYKNSTDIKYPCHLEQQKRDYPSATSSYNKYLFITN